MNRINNKNSHSQETNCTENEHTIPKQEWHTRERPELVHRYWAVVFLGNLWGGHLLSDSIVPPGVNYIWKNGEISCTSNEEESSQKAYRPNFSQYPEEFKGEMRYVLEYWFSYSPNLMLHNQLYEYGTERESRLHSVYKTMRTVS